jgi:hypothetical protein
MLLLLPPAVLLSAVEEHVDIAAVLGLEQTSSLCDYATDTSGGYIVSYYS